MNRTESQGGTRTPERMRVAKDAETMLGNGIAGLMAIGAIVLLVIGLLVGFGIVNTDDPFNNGILWLVAGLIVAINANAFRREHHIIDPDEVRRREMR